MSVSSGVDPARFPALAAAFKKQRNVVVALTGFVVIAGAMCFGGSVLDPGARAPVDLRFAAAGVAIVLFGVGTGLVAFRNGRLVRNPSWLASVVWIYEEAIAGTDSSHSVFRLGSASGLDGAIPRPQGFSSSQILAELAAHCPHAVIGTTEDRQRLYKSDPRSLLSPTLAQSVVSFRPNAADGWISGFVFALAVACASVAIVLSAVPVKCKVSAASKTSGVVEVEGKVHLIPDFEKNQYVLETKGVTFDRIRLEDETGTVDVFYNPATSASLAEGESVRVIGGTETVHQPDEATRFIAKRIRR